MDYIITKETITEPGMVEMQPVEKEIIKINYLKTATDAEGKEVQVIDESRVEETSREQLEAQIVSHQNAILEIHAKLEAIAKL